MNKNGLCLKLLWAERWVWTCVVLAFLAVSPCAAASLQNSSFEDSGGALVHWTIFNNPLPNVLADTTSPRDGEHVAKLFGGFNGAGNTSGLFQGVATVGNHTWRAACYVRHNSGDSLVGTANQVVMKIEFYSVFGGAYGGADFLGEHQIPILNGDTPEDLWVFRAFQASAPLGAVEARIAFVFIQPGGEGGAALIDAVSLDDLTAGGPPAWDVIWQDEFNDGVIDTSKWNVADIHYNKNNELQYYAPDEVYVANGNLILRSRQRPYWGFDNEGAWRYFDYTSGLVDTWGKFPSVYGRVDIRAKLPGTKGLWPAHWMLPQSGAWPPEIDIMELTGDLPWRVVMSLHWGPLGPGQLPWDIGQTANTEYWGPDYTQGFHTYTLEWWPGLLMWYIDGTLRHAVTRAQVPDETMYLILNTAVGGDWPGTPDGSTVFPQFHQIDYVRVSVPADPGFGVNAFADATAAGAVVDANIAADEYYSAAAGTNGGFGDVLGASSSLHFDTSGDGRLHIGLESQTPLSATGTGGVVIYVDSVAGGVVSTASLNSASNLPRRLASGVGLGGERATIFFAPGFRADWAICLGPDTAMIYRISESSLALVNGAALSSATDFLGGDDVAYVVDNGAHGGRVRELKVPLAYFEIEPLEECLLLATLLDGNTAYRSNEFVGVAGGNWWDGQNPGQDNVVLKHGDFIRYRAAATLGDLNADGAVTVDDFVVQATAMAGPGVTTYPLASNAVDFANADLDGDGDVDFADYADFQRRISAAP